MVEALQLKTLGLTPPRYVQEEQRTSLRDIGRITWAGRLASFNTLEHYSQETSAVLGMLSLDTDLFKNVWEPL